MQLVLRVGRLRQEVDEAVVVLDEYLAEFSTILLDGSVLRVLGRELSMIMVLM